MVDFGGLADKAKDLVGDHSDKIKDGITKAGDFVGDKIGHDKVDPIEEKLHGFVDGMSNKDEAAEPDAPPAAVTDPTDPPSGAEPPAPPPAS